MPAPVGAERCRMSQGRRHFTDEFKREAVALQVSSGRPLSRIASELGISPSMLRNWRNGGGGKPESRGQAGRWQSEYHDVMIDHDKNVGQVLNALDEAGITDNTFVMYRTDNGPNMFTWPDGAMTPFRNEKNTNWEGAFRVPCLVRWPGKIKPGTVSNEIVAHHDWLPTFLAMGRS